MNSSKALLLIVVLAVGVAIGVFVGPRVYRAHNSEASAAAVPVAPAAEPGAAPTPKPLPSAESNRKTPKIASSARASVQPTTPKLQKALKPLLHRGTDMTRAADGFRSGVQFAAVAHAAKNTDVPFVVLKHRVVDQKKSLATAIHESKPTVDARREANRAWGQAKVELSQL